MSRNVSPGLPSPTDACPKAGPPPLPAALNLSPASIPSSRGSGKTFHPVSVSPPSLTGAASPLRSAISAPKLMRPIGSTGRSGREGPPRAGSLRAEIDAAHRLHEDVEAGRPPARGEPDHGGARAPVENPNATAVHEDEPKIADRRRLERAGGAGRNRRAIQNAAVALAVLLHAARLVVGQRGGQILQHGGGLRRRNWREGDEGIPRRRLGPRLAPPASLIGAS